MAKKNSSTRQAAQPAQPLDVARYTPIISTTLAHTIGADCASDWHHRETNSTIPASVAAWRARCYADAVHDYQDRADFLQLLAAWELGFDSTLRLATSTSARAQTRAETIKRLAGQANAVTALLFALHVLHASDQTNARVTCHALASDVCRDMATLIGGAA